MIALIFALYLLSVPCLVFFAWFWFVDWGWRVP